MVLVSQVKQYMKMLRTIPSVRALHPAMPGRAATAHQTAQKRVRARVTRPRLVRARVTRSRLVGARVTRQRLVRVRVTRSRLVRVRVTRPRLVCAQVTRQVAGRRKRRPAENARVRLCASVLHASGHCQPQGSHTQEINPTHAGVSHTQDAANTACTTSSPKPQDSRQQTADAQYSRDERGFQSSRTQTDTRRT